MKNKFEYQKIKFQIFLLKNGLVIILIKNIKIQKIFNNFFKLNSSIYFVQPINIFTIPVKCAN